MCSPFDAIAYGAAWMELRAQGVAGSPEDRDHATDVAVWLQYWLAHATQDQDPAITAFITSCVEKEQALLAGAVHMLEDAKAGA